MYNYMRQSHKMPMLFGTATVGPKGQIVIPVEARHRLGIKPGDKVVVMGPAHKPQFVGLCNENVFRDILDKFDTKLSDLGDDPKTKKEK
jgi:AbrB family looped-hinge helix DNA binding protein